MFKIAATAGWEPYNEIMHKECQDFLNLPTKPGMSGIREAGWITGMPEDWIGILVNEHILPVAGGHRKGCQFYFATATLLRLADDPEFYDKAISFVRKIHGKKNDKKQERPRKVEGHE